jgi:thiol-disulfide isomerase/thioredoxin
LTGSLILIGAVLIGVVVNKWAVRPNQATYMRLIFTTFASGAFWIAATIIAMLLATSVTQIPAVSLARIGGASDPLQSLGGKLMVVNLWATWCPPCRREMPVSQDAQARHPEIVFVFANQGESEDAVQQYLAAEHFDLTNVLLDPRMQTGQAMNAIALPTTLIFDAQGKLVWRHLGEFSESMLARQIALLEVPGVRSR